jgi:hypothetical protein
MKSETINKLNELPEKIMKKELEILEMDQTIKELREKLELRETVYNIEILNAVKEDKKPKFANELSRQTELRRKLTLDDDYSDDEKVLKDKQKIINIRKIELNLLINHQANLRAIARILGNDY